MKESLKPVYAERDIIHEHEHESTLTNASPWPEADVSFHWVDREYQAFHTHQYWECLIVIRGSINNHVNRVPFYMNKQQAYLIRPTDRHAIFSRIADQPIILNFMIKKEYMSQLAALYDDTLLEQLLDSEDLSFTLDESQIKHLISETCFLQTTSNLSMNEKYFQAKLLFNELFITLLSQNIAYIKHKPEWFSNLLIKLSDLKTPIKSIEDMAIETGYSYSRLIQLFKEYAGCTIIQYITQKRIELATDRLKHSNMQILEIAAEAGYDSISHFNYTFKKHTGCTPTQYRKKYFASNTESQL